MFGLLVVLPVVSLAAIATVTFAVLAVYAIHEMKKLGRVKLEAEAGKAGVRLSMEANSSPEPEKRPPAQELPEQEKELPPAQDEL